MEYPNPNLINYGTSVYPHFRLFSQRLNSFFIHNWPVGLTQTAQTLAKAGFFYAGKSDMVRCYQCGGGIFKWIPEEDPWIEHAKFYPTCEYLLLMRSKKFIEKVQNNNKIRGKHIQEDNFKGDTSSNPSKVFSLEVNRATTPHLENTGISCMKNLKERSKNLWQGTSNKTKDKYLCKICMAENCSIVFLPCGHCFTCKLCAASLEDCSICRCKINQFVKVYFS